MSNIFIPKFFISIEALINIIYADPQDGKWSRSELYSVMNESVCDTFHPLDGLMVCKNYFSVILL